MRGKMDAELWLGVDVGTQGARALLVTSGGEVAGRGSQPIDGSREGDRHEQDPDDWWHAVAGACRQALEDAPPGWLGGIATDSTSGTFLLVDRSGEPITPGLMYDDSRAGAEASRVDDAGEPVWRSLGYRMRASWTLPKAVWLLDHLEDRDRPALLVHQADYVNGRLVGHRVATDWSHALKTGYDLLEGSWPRAVLDRLEVPERLMPEVVRPGSTLGEVSTDAAADTGVPHGTPVIAGMTDGCAAQIAAGALRDGSWSSTLGTTLGLRGASRELVRDPGGGLYCHRSPDDGWLPGGASSTGAGILSGAFPGRDLDALGEAAAGYEETEVLAYPLASRGERFPFDVPEAEGFMIGRPRNDEERFAALLQGIAYVERLCFDYVDHLGAPTGGELSLTGGATRGRYLSQLRADVLGRPVRMPRNAEPAMGMAVLAASRGRRLADVAGEMVEVRRRIEPREDRREVLLSRYLRLVAELEDRGWLDGAVADHARSRAGG